MAWQKPKAEHPWRQYKDKRVKGIKKAVATNAKPVKIFLTEILENWEETEIVTFAFGREDKYLLPELPQTKIAAWLAGILKRNYE